MNAKPRDHEIALRQVHPPADGGDRIETSRQEGRAGVPEADEGLLLGAARPLRGSVDEEVDAGVPPELERWVEPSVVPREGDAPEQGMVRDARGRPSAEERPQE